MKLSLMLILLLSVHARATDLDTAIARASQTYKVDSRDLYAIGLVESGLKHSTSLRFNKNHTYDIGMFQVNSVHWTSTCKDLDVVSLQGNCDCAALLLSKAKRKSKLDKHWIGLYHSRTFKLKISYAEKIEKAKVLLLNTDKKL